ncbi:MAG: glycosyltransferase [Candidatus Heimdallarchaeota archaeon]|nr:glycosyltransferase [Candidatus Heimdallarchaeota archaeon]
MKILRFVSYFNDSNPSGPQNQYVNLSKSMNFMDYQTLILYPSKRYQIEISDNITFVGVKSEFRFMGFTISSYPDKINFSNFDIYHLHGFRNGNIIKGLREARKNQKKMILSPHGELFSHINFIPNVMRSPYYLFDGIYKNKILDRSDKIILSSNFEKKELYKYSKLTPKLEVIYPIIKPASFTNLKKNTKVQDHIPKLITIARWSKNRRIDRILDISKLLLKLNFKHEWLIVGNIGKNVNTRNFAPQFEKIRNIVKFEKLPIKFSGYLRGESLRKKYQDADLFVYLSDYENFGQTIAEAILNKLPIISTPVGVASDMGNFNSINLVGKNNLLTAKKIIQVFESYPNSKDLVDAYSWLESKTNQQNVKNKYLEIYEDK